MQVNPKGLQEALDVACTVPIGLWMLVNPKGLLSSA
jgi:hypothetical protein